MKSVNRRGFSLIELLVVIAVIGILAAIIIPVVGKVRESGNRVVCASNLRQIMTTTMVYMQDHDGLMPLVHKNEEGDGGRWAVQLQRYMSTVADRSNEGRSAFTCPSDSVVRTELDSTPCSYGLNVYVHKNGISSNLTRKAFLGIVDPSKAVFYGEVWSEVNTVLHSLSTGAGDSFLSDYHNGKGSHYAFADGHVEFLSKARIQEDNSALMRSLQVN